MSQIFTVAPGRPRDGFRHNKVGVGDQKIVTADPPGEWAQAYHCGGGNAGLLALMEPKSPTVRAAL